VACAAFPKGNMYMRSVAGLTGNVQHKVALDEREVVRKEV